jgi:hypothetical protein
VSKVYGWVVAVIITMAALFSLQRSSEKAGRDAERVRIAEEQAQVAHAAYRQERERLDSIRRKNGQLERSLASASKIGKMAIDSANLVAQDAHRVLADSNASRAQLLSALSNTATSLDSLSAQFRAYLAADSLVHYRWGVERESANRALDAAERALIAKDAVIRALKAKECKVLWFPCPSRTSVMVGTALVTAGVLTLARD